MPQTVVTLPGKQLEKSSKDLSADEVKVKDAVEAMEKKKAIDEIQNAEVAEPVPVTLHQLEELLLRSTYLQAKLLESQYLASRTEYMAHFDRTPNARNILQRMEQATADFNEALNETHTLHGTDASRYVYDMDMKALVPRQGEGNG